MAKYNKEIICPSCNTIRIVSRAQEWNIRTGKNSGRCPKCKIGSDLTGLQKGRAWNKGLKGYNKGHPPYNIKYGSANPSWKGGVTSENKKIRNSKEYASWRKAVFERDDYTCVKCQQKGGQIHADHIKPFAYYVDLRFDIENGQTLCISCHKKTDTYLYKSRSHELRI